MAFALKPFRAILTAGKEVLDEALASVRSRAVAAKANLKIAEIDEKLIGLEREINELCIDKDPNLDAIVKKIDEYELAERKAGQIKKLVAELFPAEPAVG